MHEFSRQTLNILSQSGAISDTELSVAIAAPEQIHIVVAPAQAGAHITRTNWIPACAGMTSGRRFSKTRGGRMPHICKPECTVSMIHPDRQPAPEVPA